VARAAVGRCAASIDDCQLQIARFIVSIADCGIAAIEIATDHWVAASSDCRLVQFQQSAITESECSDSPISDRPMNRPIGNRQSVLSKLA
jgi:hypothetical protein